MAYNIAHTGPKSHPGGVHVGFVRAAYHSPGIHRPAIPATPKQSPTQTINAKMSENLAMSYHFPPARSLPRTYFCDGFSTAS